MKKVAAGESTYSQWTGQYDDAEIENLINAALYKGTYTDSSHITGQELGYIEGIDYSSLIADAIATKKLAYGSSDYNDIVA